MVAATRELSIDLQRAISDAEERGDAINVSASLERAQTLDTLSTELESILGSVQRSGASSLEVNAILDRAGSIRRLQDELADAVRVVDATAPDIELDVDADTERLREFQVELRNTDREAASLGGTFRSVLGAAAPFAIGIAGIGAAAGTTAPLLASLTAATLEIAPAAGVAVSGLLTLKLATAAVQIAMIGVGDAIETAFDPEASPEDLAKAMERLAPNARAFVTELRGMRSALSEIQQNVQDNVFANLDAALTALSTSVLPQVSTALERAGTSLNQMALGAVRSALVLSESGALGQALNSSTKSLQNLETVPGSIVTGLGAIAAAAGPSLERLTQAASSAADRISEQLLRSFASGELEKTISGAVDTVAQLGRSIGNIFSGLGNVFDGLTQNGAGLFDTLEKITQAFEDATASKGFQDALGALSSLMGTVVNTVLPLFSDALAALGPVFTTLGPPLEKLVETLGSAFGEVLEALGPVLVALAGTIGSLAVAISPLLELLGTLIASILPILTPLFEAWSDVLKAAAPFVAALADAVGSILGPILQGLAPILEALLIPMVSLYETVFPALTHVVEELQPSIARLGEVLGKVVEAVGPLLASIITLGLAILEKLRPTLQPVIDLLLDLAEGALQGLAAMIEDVVIPILESLTKIFSGDIQEGLDQADAAFEAFGIRMIQIIGNAHARIIVFFNDLSLKVVQAIQDMAAGVGRWILELVNDAVATFRELPGEIEAAVGDLGTLLFSAGANVVSGLIAGLRSQLGSLVSAAQSIADTVANTIDGALEIFSPSRRTERSGKNTVAGFVKGINATLGSVEEAAEAMVKPLDILGERDPASAIRPVATGFDRVTGRGTNVVNVYIGNQLLNQFINDAMRTTLDQRDRTIATGVRI